MAKRQDSSELNHTKKAVIKVSLDNQSIPIHWLSMCYRTQILYICRKNFLSSIDNFTTERLFLYYVF